MKNILNSIALLLICQAGFSQNSILWEISGNGLTAPSYLMGTLKFIGQGEFYLPAEAVTRLKGCQVFAIEDQVDHKAQMELNKAAHFPAGKSLATEMAPADYEKIANFFSTEFKVSKSKFDKRFSKLIPLALSINMTRMSLGEDVKFYDIELLKIARKARLETYSLEPIERESQAIQAFPMKDQELALLHSVNNFGQQKSEYHALEKAYLAGDLDKVFEYSLHPTENNPIFIEEFYTKRNLEWLPKITKMMGSKPSFVAVGVSHLEGEKGLLALLREKGYTLTPIPVSR